MTRPLAGTGLKMDPALVETVLADARDEPGALPMVSHALLETWRRPQGVRLTLTGYHEAGGVRGAIAQTAEDAYLNKLDPGQQQIAKEIFVRLATLGEGTGGARRRASPDDLAGDARRAETASVLELLAADRLVTLGEDSVQVAHEALIRAWPRLDDWLAEDRDWVQERTRLTQAAQEWDDLRQDPGGLYRGARLVAARDRAAGREHELNDLPADLAAAREDGADPGRAGCGGDAVTLERVNIPLRPGVNLGTVELRHSAGCAASWGRFTPTNPIIDTLGPVTVRVGAERPDDTITAPWGAPYLGLQVYGALLRTDEGCVRARVEIRPHTGRAASAATGCHRP